MLKFSPWLLPLLLLLSITSLSQNVGIGNSNPAFSLDVSGQVRIRSINAVSTAGIYFNKIDNSATRAYVGMHSDSYVGFFGVPLNGWGMLMNTTSGNVGIGNADPAYSLDLSGRLRIRSQSAANTSGIYFNKIDNSNTQAFVGMHSDSYVGIFGVPLNDWGILMNTTSGNVGIGNADPGYSLDVSGRLRIRSESAVNTSGIYFNKIDNSNTQAFVGMHSDSYVGLFGVPLNNWGFLMNTTSGNIGIGNSPSPQALLHVVRGQKTNGPLLPTSAAIIEGNLGGWLQLSNNNNIEGGVLSGNEQTAIRSALIFGADSSVQLRTGGNFTKLSVDKSGNTNITGNAVVGGAATISGNATVNGELRRPATGNANLVPICFGSVNLVGTILSGTGNFSVTWGGGSTYYITITGESYNSSDYCTQVTPLGAYVYVLVSASSGRIEIRFNDSSGSLPTTPFHFIVYKP